MSLWLYQLGVVVAAFIFVFIILTSRVFILGDVGRLISRFEQIVPN